jgi:probable rRNA maturation factor
VRQRSIYVGPWRIDFTVRDGVTAPVPLNRLGRAVAVALDAARAPKPASIGVFLSDDRELARLNAEHMGASGPTDVLSFPLLPPDAFPASAGAADPLPPGRRPQLGDIVVSVERAGEQARDGRGGQTGDVRWSVADEVLLLVTHGALHLCGWDHAEPTEEAAMRALENRLLAEVR